MKTGMYQLALVAAVAVSIALAVALGYVLRSEHGAAPAIEAQDSVVARGPAATANAVHRAGAAIEPALTPIQLSAQRLQQIGVTTATASIKDVSQYLAVPGNVDIDEQRISYVQTRFAGWVESVFANATYQYVRKGQPLFTVYSPDLVSSEQEYLLARKNQDTFAKDAHGMDREESGWLLEAAEERLRQFGVSPQLIADLKQNGTVQREITVDSPASGFITERNAMPNAYVQPETKLYAVADLSTVWVYANVFQGDVGRLKPGDRAQVTVDAYPGRQFNGRIDQILPQVDMTTRTVRVRLVFSNPGVALKPGMYVNVAISIPLGRQLVVPSSAVLEAGTRAIAFIDHGNGNLEPRAIETGQRVDDSVVVLKGLKAGDRVVSSADFLVDSETELQSAFGLFAPPAEKSATGANAAAAGQIQVDLSTQPSPPRKGANAVRIRLSGADRKPVTGVQATAAFNMPAMPAMGMAREHMTVALVEKGNGIYEGSFELDAGGTWQVTVTIQRGGRTIATKQLSLSATGDM